jgi:HAE1 family hydrophobic/amphiphilic exporter-1/multidrug efflux pump
MTSLAFMFGVLPLAVASGAGSASRRAIGTGVLGGMLSATVLGIFFVPCSIPDRHLAGSPRGEKPRRDDDHAMPKEGL